MDASPPVVEQDREENENKNLNLAENDINNNNTPLLDKESHSIDPSSLLKHEERAPAGNNGNKLESSNGATDQSNFINDLFTFFTRNVIDSDRQQQQVVEGSADHLSPLPFLGPFHSLQKKSDSQKSLNLVKFITVGMANNLKTLGVEDLDSKEYVDTWLTHRRQKRWKQSLPNTNFIKHRESYPCIDPVDLASNMANPAIKKILNTFSKPETLSAFNPSEPDSSILRISGRGNEELVQFVSKMEEIRTHLNNASCTLLQVQMILILPYFKLLTGNQLEISSHARFVNDWIQIIVGMVAELRPDSPKEAKIMLTREYLSLLSESKKLYKCISKLYKKAGCFHKANEVGYKKFLGRLHPKSLTTRSRVQGKSQNQSPSTLMNNAFLSETIQFAPVPLYRTNIIASDLLHNHLLLSKSKEGGRVIFKKEPHHSWESFEDLPFQRRRELFLTTTEDLHWALKSSLNTTKHVKELFVKGYPESIRSKIRENLEYLKKVSEQSEMLVLSKATIATNVKSFLESLSRLVRILKDTLEISKYFYKNVKNNSKKFMPPDSVFFANRVTNLPAASAKDPNTVLNSTTLMFENAKIKLLVPFPTSPNPMEGQFLMPLE